MMVFRCSKNELCYDSYDKCGHNTFRNVRHSVRECCGNGRHTYDDGICVPYTDCDDAHQVDNQQDDVLNHPPTWNDRITIQRIVRYDHQRRRIGAEFTKWCGYEISFIDET